MADQAAELQAYIEKHHLQDEFQAALQDVCAQQPLDPMLRLARWAEVRATELAKKESISDPLMPYRAAALQKTASEKLIFDAHCHYSDYMQKTEGLDALSEAMDKFGVGYTAICGNPFKKTWVGRPEDKPPVHHLYDDGDLYHYSACDGSLYRAINGARVKHSNDFISRFSMLSCGLNLGDYSCGDLAESILQDYPSTIGFGEIVLQSDDINNVTIKGGNWTYTEPSVKRIIDVCAKQEPKMPFVFYSEARSVTSKPYRNHFEYLDEIEMVCGYNPEVTCLWCGAGVFMRGQWKDPSYTEVLKELLAKYPNLYISFTPQLVSGKYTGITREDALNLAKELSGRIVLGTQAMGVFLGAVSEEFEYMPYETECAELKKFAAQIETREGKGIAAALRYRTACKIYNLPLPDDPDADMSSPVKLARGETIKALLKKQQSQGTATNIATSFIASMAYGGSGGSSKVCPPSASDKKYKTIDCHLHLLDFLQKSSGTSAALKAMDGCDVEHALVFGMPCCKKWMFYREDQKPLYYQDDNGPCYVYAYADQMVADAWLALDDKDRRRFAPCFASFDPTDLGAIDHVKRLYNKYPKMWRGIGEIMCRHDDLTTMLLGKEIPRVNHPALNAIYEFAVETGLPCLVHHNADRVGDKDGNFSFVYEVEDVLKRYPTLKFTWVHAGVSRRAFEPNHHEMIDDMCSRYPNLKVDISWVVWEDVICDENGIIKDGWVKCIEKHNTKFFIGSDNVAQYFPITDTTVNLLASNIVKYYQLFDKLTPEAAQNVAYQNAYKEYFETWETPSCAAPDGHDGAYAYTRMPSYYPTECLDPIKGVFTYGATDLDDDGKY